MTFPRYDPGLEMVDVSMIVWKIGYIELYRTFKFGNINSIIYIYIIIYLYNLFSLSGRAFMLIPKFTAV